MLGIRTYVCFGGRAPLSAEFRCAQEGSDGEVRLPAGSVVRVRKVGSGGRNGGGGGADEARHCDVGRLVFSVKLDLGFMLAYMNAGRACSRRRRNDI